MGSQNLNYSYQEINDRLAQVSQNASDIAALQDEPSLHDLWLKAGATHQAETDTYTLNEVSGLTKIDMLYIWFYGKFIPSQSAMVQGEVGNRLKTNFPHLIGDYTSTYLTGINLDYRFNANFNIKRIRFLYSTLSNIPPESLSVFASSINYAFWTCKALTIIDNVINISNITNSANVQNAFLACDKLQSVRLKGLKVSISFKDCKDLTVEDTADSSLGYIVENAANTSQITITLHATAFAKVPQTLIQKAKSKQITIASA